eukprot:gnl/MRDRNA2_/MRDRNA2_31362_c0_seq2.p1 gnl/MRDRNA2_/MRDRNA2_31362_c0~~gnl/MRDRNA2_/MRDRNA2_31362_c0_seq2.p1  ORF type:complete len:456 (+),score=41.66 gnl/MRDRNA2_/MRDRNA2_31362_c0_seq2:111-1478(+)
MVNAVATSRWLLCPVVFIVAHWRLLVGPELLLKWYPAPWTPPSGKGLEQVLPPHPRNLYQAHELGWYASIYSRDCQGINLERSDNIPGRCQELLREAASVLGLSEISGAQLQAVRGFLKDLDEQQSLMDRVRGFFSFVNIMWLISIVGILCSVGPMLVYIAGPMLYRLASAVVTRMVVPIGKALHRWGVFEVCGYMLALAFSIQGSRYPAGQEDAAMMVALTGGLALLPLWLYSTKLHVHTSGGNEKIFMAVTNSLLAATLAPLALIHDSRLIGFLTILAVYGALGFVCGAFGLGYYIGFAGEEAITRCITASVLLIVTFTTLRICAADLTFMRPFATGAMCLGNVMYFLGLLIWSSKSRSYREAPPYVARQAIMIGSLLIALLVGNVFSLNSMSNTATTFLVLWLMEKELEVRWSGFGVVVLFANFVFLYFISHYLHTHPEHIVSLFDPTGLYV